MKKILCFYSSRQIDSNLFMASTVFRGLKEAGYETDIYFNGTKNTIEDFKKNYSEYFNTIYFDEIHESKLFHLCQKSGLTNLLYSYYRHFLADGFCKLNSAIISKITKKQYDYILAFVPTILAGQKAYDFILKSGLTNLKLIQFWTDPISMGRCNSYKEIPWTRFIHKWQESRLLKYADKVVFCYPLLCENEQKLHPNYSEKMTWSDISYVSHNFYPKKKHNKPLIGLFGAYQTHVRNIKPLLEAIKELTEFDFIIRGDGELPFDVSNISNLNIEQGRKSLDEIEKLENECDILLSLGGKSGLTHPAGKTFYYASYNKPIIHIGDGKNAFYFESYLKGFEGRFVHCFNTKAEIINTITDTVNLLSTFELKIPSRMDASNIAKKIIED